MTDQVLRLELWREERPGAGAQLVSQGTIACADTSARDVQQAVDQLLAQHSELVDEAGDDADALGALGLRSLPAANRTDAESIARGRLAQPGQLPPGAELVLQRRPAWVWSAIATEEHQIKAGSLHAVVHVRVPHSYGNAMSSDCEVTAEQRHKGPRGR
jgi:hypothetical protein